MRVGSLLMYHWKAWVEEFFLMTVQNMRGDNREASLCPVERIAAVAECTVIFSRAWFNFSSPKEGSLALEAADKVSTQLMHDGKLEEG